MPVACSFKCGNIAVLKRPKNGDTLCKECFFVAFETEIHNTIIKNKLFRENDKVAVAASGGKDSTVLAFVLKLLNERYNYGVNFCLLSIDEGISGYRDDSLRTVQKNKDDYEMPLKILSYEEIYGWSMDSIVKKIGKKNNCTFCGVFRRQALDRGAALIEADCLVTGHNADDIAETVLINVLRGDVSRLQRCTNVVTMGDNSIPRCKPLKYAYEKEIVMYAYFKKLHYFSTECIYSPDAYRGHVRSYLKNLEKIRPSVILDIIYSGENMNIRDDIPLPVRRNCEVCGFISSQNICKACMLLEGLNKGLPKLGISKSYKIKKIKSSSVNNKTNNL